MVKTLDLQLWVAGSIPGHDTARLFLRLVTVFAGKLSWGITMTYRTTQHCIPPWSLNRVPASAGSKCVKVTAGGWQVTLCDHIWCGNFDYDLLYTIYLLHANNGVIMNNAFLDLI